MADQIKEALDYIINNNKTGFQPIVSLKDGSMGMRLSAGSLAKVK